jgi:hypothetical protein
LYKKNKFREGGIGIPATLFSPHSSSQTLAITVSPVSHKNNSVHKISEIFIPLHSLRN